MSMWWYLTIGMQILCAVHALNRGKPYYWLFIILFFPGIGCVIYLIVEWIPDLRRGAAWRGDTAFGLWRLKRRIKDLEEMAKFSNTVEVRARLAQAYLENKESARAVEIYRSCLQGVFAADPAILLPLARALFANGEHQACLDHLCKLDQLNYRDYRDPRELLKARALDALGRDRDALEGLRKIVGRYPGEEARCRFALLLEKTGGATEAQGIYRQMLTDARRADRRFRQREKEWLKTAKRRLAELERIRS
jgi:hypothetical protein